MANADRQIALAREALEKSKRTLAELEKKKAEVPPVKSVSPKLLVKDHFAKKNPNVWEMKAGKWKFEGGKLVQSQVGTDRAVLRLKQNVPGDFQATLKYIPTGGQMWKSVGLVFDSVNGNDVLVYLMQ